MTRIEGIETIFAICAGSLFFLSKALRDWGIGEKTAADYGRFVFDKSAKDKLLSEQEIKRPKARMNYKANTSEIEVFFNDQKAAPFKISKVKFEKHWPGVLRRRSVLVEASVKQIGNKIELVSILGKRIETCMK